MKTLLLFFAALSQSLGAELIKSEAQARQEAFPEAARFEPLALSYTPELRAALRADLGRLPGEKPPRMQAALDASGNTVGFFVADEELGKHQPISYAVAVDAGGRIRSLEMLVFRESQGDGVRSRRFRGQFKGKRLEDPLQLGRDLDAVSGATISSRTLAYGARKSLWLAQKAGQISSSQAVKAKPETGKKKEVKK